MDTTNAARTIQPVVGSRPDHSHPGIAAPKITYHWRIPFHDPLHCDGTERYHVAHLIEATPRITAKLCFRGRIVSNNHAKKPAAGDRYCPKCIALAGMRLDIEVINPKGAR